MKSSKKKCRTCGYKKSCHEKVCKARGKQCNYCLKWNHFPKSLNCKLKRKDKKMSKRKECLQNCPKEIGTKERDSNKLYLSNKTKLSIENIQYVNEWIKKQKYYYP